MPMDWAEDGYFCINTQACPMNASGPNQLGRELCFNAVKRGTVIYVKCDTAPRRPSAKIAVPLRTARQ
jgi:hypothetical protein